MQQVCVFTRADQALSCWQLCFAIIQLTLDRLQTKPDTEQDNKQPALAVTHSMHTLQMLFMCRETLPSVCHDTLQMACMVYFIT